MSSLTSILTSKQSVKIVDKLAEEKRKEILAKLDWKSCSVHGEYVTRRVLKPDETVPANTNLYIHVTEGWIYRNIPDNFKTNVIKNYNGKTFIMNVEIYNEIIFTVVFSTLSILEGNLSVVMTHDNTFNFSRCETCIETKQGIQFPLSCFINCGNEFYTIEMRKSLLAALPFLTKKRIEILTDYDEYSYLDMFLMTIQNKLNFLDSKKFDIKFPEIIKIQSQDNIDKLFNILIKVKIDGKNYLQAIDNRDFDDEEIVDFITTYLPKSFHGYKISVKNETDNENMVQLTGLYKKGKKGKITFVICYSSNMLNYDHSNVIDALDHHLEELI